MCDVWHRRRRSKIYKVIRYRSQMGLMAQHRWPTVSFDPGYVLISIQLTDIEPTEAPCGRTNVKCCEKLILSWVTNATPCNNSYVYISTIVAVQYELRTKVEQTLNSFVVVFLH